VSLWMGGKVFLPEPTPGATFPRADFTCRHECAVQQQSRPICALAHPHAGAAEHERPTDQSTQKRAEKRAVGLS
jgi:hypothetical protein